MYQGDPDSLALAFLCKVFAKEYNSNFTALIVDHKLRKESGIEAKQVRKILTRNKIKNRILTWNGKIPNKNIQFNARKIRYSLFLKVCKKTKCRKFGFSPSRRRPNRKFFYKII